MCSVPETERLSECLNSFRIQGLLPNFYYIPDFITAAEEDSLLRSHIQIPSNRWVSLSHRRLQAHPSTLTPKNTLLASPLPTWLTAPIIPRFERLGVFEDAPHRSPNHVLANEYRPGEGIMPHEDGGAYYPIVATVSLGGVAVLDVYEKVGGNDSREEVDAEDRDVGTTGTDGEKRNGRPMPCARILQEPRSLLITTGTAYTDLMHGIAEIDVDENLDSKAIANWGLLGDAAKFESGSSRRDTRTSLTYRDVLKTSKVGSRILGTGKK
ncbi:hypothetical protein B0A49_05232 [Cryomyces minteri]|uniref:Fe2OG dioxygenase domain-containing protein n=1 Tax=Cryomyces minteri TaxID=331657 RepID=A0A4U0X2X1_9PEZI|nr:hypothetical protein B0A49_05232 [Cryomyces minteri]